MNALRETLMISADSHVIEPVDLWAKQLPAAYRDRAPQYPKHPFQAREGGTNPVARIKEMAMDGVSAEVLYPSLTMDQFGLTDAGLQEACLRVYNDWLIDYCKHAPERLFGVATVSTFDIDKAIAEAERCKKAGMRGLMIWQVPPAELSFATRHYEKFWAAAQEMDMPINLHILTGAPYPPGAVGNGSRDPAKQLLETVNMKILYAQNSLIQIIASGVLERFPRLKIVFVENEASWLPCALSQWDKYCARKGRFDSEMTMLPSEYFQRQVYATFFNDPPSRLLFREWGVDNCMWSNDFPHLNSTWPNSREVIARDLGELPASTQAKLLHENVMKLYGLPDALRLAA